MGGRGFASMDRERQRAIASKGGRAAHASGHAHQWNSQEARVAGRKGGLAAHQRPTDDVVQTRPGQEVPEHDMTGNAMPSTNAVGELRTAESEPQYTRRDHDEELRTSGISEDN